MSIPTGWFTAGSAPDQFEFGVDTNERHTGTRCAFVRARNSSPDGFGTLMQEVLADQFRSRRVRLAAWIKSRDVTGWAGLWMRIDGPSGRRLAFDNMQHRPIRGTTEWTRYDVVLDVAAASEVIAFGVLLDGGGAVWVDDVAIEIVGDDVPVTGTVRSAPSDQPRNLDFAEP